MDHSGRSIQYNIVNPAEVQNLSNTSYVCLLLCSSVRPYCHYLTQALDNAEDDLQRNKLFACGDGPQRT